ncbi:MAG: N-acetylmuramoyl-L-alanine amidase [Gammaproteobacteria bacterium]|nr:N-acetylmuramoyl-L-alanine amidase [Gammaproteobacteria bacterium]
MNPDILQHPLTYSQRLESRRVEDISLVVIHCTELPDMTMAREFGKKIHHPESRTGNSGHFYIDRDGVIEQWVPADRVAHHVRGFNAESIGIELVNLGRYPDWFRSDHQQVTEPYPDTQVEALMALLRHLEEQYPCLENIAGHSDLDTDMLPSEDQSDIRIRRKIDPGPHFPWCEIMNAISLNLIKE